MWSTKMYTLRSSDNETFEVSEQVAMMSQTIKHLIDDNCSEDGIPLPNVTSAVLAKIVEYCKKHAPDGDESAATSASGDASTAGGTVVVDEDLKAWDHEFVQVETAMVLDLINAANYLNIKELLDLACQAVADMIKGKQPDELRKMFNIVNDFTPEEEAQVRRENSWALE